ncbi:unnamed protein product [Rotaria sp. Silwood1]|nr:unnamed protein product [Rotaria sp. Silwood1]CAF1681905.1 unnamed protein product [Rotaria sp. Silwood1]
MKAALALVFLSCIVGSMASDSRSQFVDQLVQQGQVVAQAVFTQLQQQIISLVQQAVNQLSSLVSSLGRFDLSWDGIVHHFSSILNHLIGNAIGSVIQGFLGGPPSRGFVDLAGVFHAFLQQIKEAITQMGQQILSQGLAAALSSFGGSRGFGDIFATLQQQIANAVTVAQGVLQGALGNLSALGSTVLDASKEHWEQLQEQLVGHGLNALGSISETINNLHGTITGGR